MPDDLIERLERRAAYEHAHDYAEDPMWAEAAAALAAKDAESAVFRNRVADLNHRVAVRETVAAQLDAEIAALRADLETSRNAHGALVADMMGMQDGSLVRDQTAQIVRLTAELAKAESVLRARLAAARCEPPEEHRRIRFHWLEYEGFPTIAEWSNYYAKPSAPCWMAWRHSPMTREHAAAAGYTYLAPALPPKSK